MRLATHVLDNHRQQQFTDLRACRAEVIHHPSERLVALLDLGLFLQAGPGRALLPHERCSHSRHTLNGLPALIEQLELLGVELKVAIDLEPRARLRHVLTVELDVSIHSRYLPAQLSVGHIRGAIGADRAHRRHAPADFTDAAVQTVLRVQHAAHIAVGHARVVLTESEERHIREVMMRVRRRLVGQLMRPASTHAVPGR